jgi:hypothetical protein
MTASAWSVVKSARAVRIAAGRGVAVQAPRIAPMSDLPREHSAEQ